MSKSTFLIQSTQNKSIGTGFCIDKDAYGSFILTCTHVVEECGEESLEILGKKAILIEKGLSEEIDLAVVYVKGLINSEALELCKSIVTEGLLFEISGYQPYKKTSYKFEKINGVLNKSSSIHVNKNDISVYELSIDKKDYITKGFSGSAVLLADTNKVIAVATDKQRNTNDAYGIPITYLSSIWDKTPKFLECKDEISYSDNQRNIFIDKIKEQIPNIVIGVITAVFLGVLTNFINDVFNKVDDKLIPSSQSQSVVITGSNTTVTQVINSSNDTTKRCKDGVANYQKTIKELSTELSESKMAESKKIISSEIEEAKKQLIAFKKACS